VYVVYEIRFWILRYHEKNIVRSPKYQLMRSFSTRIQLLISVLFERPHPTIVDINLTNLCNQKCVYCEIGQGIVRAENKEKAVLNLEDLKWIIDQMAYENVPSLVLQGGEPFLFRDLFPVIEYAFRHKREISIVTNGMQIPKLSDEELATLKKAHCSISVSIDSFYPETENFIRGVSSASDNAIEGIKILVKNQIPVTIGTVITKYNFQDIAHLVKKADVLGVQSVNFQPVINNSNYPEVDGITQKNDLNISPEHLDRLEQEFIEILAFEKIHAIKTNTHILQKWIKQYIAFCSGLTTKNTFFFEYHLKRFFCVVLYNRIRINYYGELLPCHFIQGDISIHDDPNQSLIQTWNRSCQQIRTSIKQQHYPRQCNGCVCSYSLNLFTSVIKHPLMNIATIPWILSRK
jgi:MoaA/NifB/PqqE/SkfB family radical SAM enzyme